MPIAVQITKSQHRFDTATPPVVTASGLTGGGRLLLAEERAALISSGPPGYRWNAPNRTFENAPVKLYEEFGTTWTTTAGVNAISLGLEKTGGDGFSGGYAGEVTGNLTIEGRSASAPYKTGISLQSGTVSYNWFAANEVEHSLIFGNGGVGEIWEMGVNKMPFHHSVGDSGLIVREGDIVKYYLIRGDTERVELLRSTRSKLASTARAVALLYDQGARIEQLLIGVGGIAMTSASIYGVLDSGFQDWENAASIESLAEKTMNKDKREDFTYFTRQKNITTISLNLGWREEEEYQAFKEFYQWHDLDKPFIFKDSARAKLQMQASYPLAENEFFVRFVSSWKDTPLGAGLYGVSVDIREVVDPPILLYGA